MANVPTVTKKYIPQIDYVSRDYTAILTDLTAVAQQFNPTWSVSDPTDIGVALLETFAYLGDILSFYTDRMASEGFIGTASQRASVLQIAAMLGYTPTPLSAATVTLTFTNNDTVNSVTIPALTQVSSSSVVNGQSTQVTFETDTDLVLAASATGTVSATQGITTTLESLGTSDGTPSQVFKLSNPKVIINSTGSNIFVFVNNLQYTYSSSLVDNSSYDSVFTTTMDADGYTYIVFGDGVGGRIPSATYTISCTYRVGVGSDGNVAANSITQVTSGTASISVSQPSAAVGGADQETTDSIKYNVPRALRTLRRAVSLKDYAYLALQVSGVAKANSEASVWSNVNLYIAPFGASAINIYGPYTNSGTAIITSIAQTKTDGTAGTGALTYSAAATTFSSLYTLWNAAKNSYYATVSGAAPVDYNIYTGTAGSPGALITNVASNGSSFTVATGMTSFPTYSATLSTNITVAVTGPITAAFSTLKSSVINYFTDKVAPNVTLSVLPPTYVPVDLEMTLHVLPQYNQASVVTQVQGALSALVSYNNAFFADRIPPHFILNAITNIDGVDYATVEHLRRNSNEQWFSISTWTIPTTSTATLTFYNAHNIVAGQNIRIYNSGGIDGTYAVNSVTSTTVTITIPTSTVTPTGVTGNTGTGNFGITNLSSTSGIAVGMGVSGSGITSGTVVTSISGTTIGVSKVLTGNNTGTALTFFMVPVDATNTVKVIGVDSITSNGVITYGITCGANEIPTKGTFTITATGGLV